jgi:hypothetical protein
MTEHIVAVYHTEADATAAAGSLEEVGIPFADIRQYTSSALAKAEPAEQTTTPTSGSGFWAWLFGGESMTETTRTMYSNEMYDRKVAGGSVVLSVTVYDMGKIDQVMSTMEIYNPVDIDEGSAVLDPIAVPPDVQRVGVETIPPGEVAQPGTAPLNRVMGGAESVLNDAAGQPGMASSYPSGHVAPSTPPEVVP